MSQPTTPTYPLYNTSFTLHRVSPLHISTSLPLNTAVLQHHARRFREILVGDVLRGVRVGLEQDSITAAGTLKKVTWRLLPEEDAWLALQAEDETRLDETTVTIDGSKGIWITVECDRSTYTGILLKKEDDESDDGFQHFPLLMTRMPGSLREILLEYLESSFDTRVSSLQFPSRKITALFEDYLTHVCQDEDGGRVDSAARIRALRNVVKETEIFVGFDYPSISGALKTLEIHLLREDIPRMLTRGNVLRDGHSDTSPFMRALSTYVKGHLALDLEHESVKILRIACGAFVLGAEGKVKLSEPVENTPPYLQVRATNKLVGRLIEAAVDSHLLKPDM